MYVNHDLLCCIFDVRFETGIKFRLYHRLPRSHISSTSSKLEVTHTNKRRFGSFLYFLQRVDYQQPELHMDLISIIFHFGLTHYLDVLFWIIVATLIWALKVEVWIQSNDQDYPHPRKSYGYYPSLPTIHEHPVSSPFN